MLGINNRLYKKAYRLDININQSSFNRTDATCILMSGSHDLISKASAVFLSFIRLKPDGQHILKTGNKPPTLNNFKTSSSGFKLPKIMEIAEAFLARSHEPDINVKKAPVPLKLFLFIFILT